MCKQGRLDQTSIERRITKTAGQDKLRSIPVRLLFSDPDLNLRAEYSMFDRQTGRPLCVGNGETCRRYTETGIQSPSMSLTRSL